MDASLPAFRRLHVRTTTKGRLGGHAAALGKIGTGYVSYCSPAFRATACSPGALDTKEEAVLREKPLQVTYSQEQEELPGPLTGGGGAF